MPLPQDLTIPNVMEHLQISRDTIQALVHNGDLRGYKVGSRWRFELSEIEDFKRRNQLPANTGITARAIKRNRAPTPAGYMWKPGDKVV